MSEAQQRCIETRRLLNDGGRLLDVRTQGEFSAGALDGAFNLPLQEIHRADALLDRDTPLVVYCGTGMRSNQAKTFLQSMGFDTVHDLGGFNNIQHC